MPSYCMFLSIFNFDAVGVTRLFSRIFSFGAFGFSAGFSRLYTLMLLV